MVLTKVGTAKWNQPTCSDLELSEAGRCGDVTRARDLGNPGLMIHSQADPVSERVEGFLHFCSSTRLAADSGTHTRGMETQTVTRELICNNLGDSKTSSPTLSHRGKLPWIGLFCFESLPPQGRMRMEKREQINVSLFPGVPGYPLRGLAAPPYLEKVLVHDLQAAAVAHTLAGGTGGARGHGPGRGRRGQRGRGGARVLVPRSLGAHLQEAARRGRRRC